MGLFAWDAAVAVADGDDRSVRAEDRVSAPDLLCGVRGSRAGLNEARTCFFTEKHELTALAGIAELEQRLDRSGWASNG